MFPLKGATYEGHGFEGKICGVSILRAGEVRLSLYEKHNDLLITLNITGHGSWSSRSMP